MTFKKILKQIKELKIQGAQNIAISSVMALKWFIDNEGIKYKENLLFELEKRKKKLMETRPTEPAMRNSLKYILENIKHKQFIDIKKEVNKRADFVLKQFKKSNNILTTIGAKKINQNSVIFTHCHSSTVINILKRAHNTGKKFKVYNTETRPLFQGRKTARELISAGIPVVHYIDSAAKFALKKTDMVLIGCDAILSTGRVVNKIGTSMIIDFAVKQEIPVYVCTNSWKFDPQTIVGYEEPLEKRNRDEVWHNAPKGIKIENISFETIDPDKITGIISELGIYQPSVFVEEVKRENKWMF
ncbi:hypothetical protein ISS04_00120 [Candidatus Woesearchaeota archaeon]|nr:hypothetical protein [Candidatus Woesearchaeota archaeon]